MPKLDDARKRSVDNLQRLYTVVVSLALAEGLKRTLLVADKVQLHWSNKWVMLLSLLCTVIPFYHGANRYLDATYVTGERTPKRYSLMVDFLFLFAQGLLLFTLALTISAGEVETVDKYFFWGLGLLLISDVIWILTTTITTVHETDEQQKSAFKYFPWLALNVIATALIFTLVHYKWWLGLLVLTFVRSALDYLIAHDSYYPETPTAA